MAVGTTKTELPRRGDILRYVYLFHRESRDRDEGVKERPVVVIDADPATRRVAVLAVTTKGERHPGTIALPDTVATAAGLSRGSAVVVGKYNAFTWLGYDIRPVAGGLIAGRLPPGFAQKVLTAAASGGAIAVERD